MESRQVIARPTEEQSMSYQPVEDMEIDTSYQDTMNGSKFPVSETVEIGVENNQIVISDIRPKAEPQLFGVETDPATTKRIEDIIRQNDHQLSAASPKSNVSIEDLEEFENDRIELNQLVQQDPDKIPVKKMRKVVPKMRMHCYMASDDIKAKRKHKHLWDERPSDWPQNVPFKDPNNKAKGDVKPGKEVLTQMFMFLREKFLYQNMQDAPEVKEVRQLHHPSEDIDVSPQPPQQVDAVVMETASTPVQVQQLPPSPVADPVSGLYKRIEGKIKQVEHLVADNQECREALHQVFQDIIKALYIQSKAITMCGYFLDAGHDLENLLDKGIAFGKLLDSSVINKGCHMIIKKYQNTQRSCNGNINNITTPLYRCQDATPLSMMKNRFGPQNTFRYPQSVSDGMGDMFIKQEPMSPGKPSSPATQLAKDMQEVQIKEETNEDYMESFGIQSKARNVDLISGLVEVRPSRAAIQEIHDLTKDDKINDSLTKPTDSSSLEVDLAEIMKDIQNGEQYPPISSDFDQTHSLLSNLETGTITGCDVNLNSTTEPVVSDPDILDDVLGLFEKYGEDPSVYSACQATTTIAQTSASYAQLPPSGQQPVNWPSMGNCTNTPCPKSPEIPTLVENFAENENGGGKVPTQRRRASRQDKTGKGRGKYQHL